MKSVLPAALLLFALSACSGNDSGAALQEPPAADADGADSDDINAEPPATAPADPAATPPTGDADAALARLDGYGDLRFGMSAAEAKQAWGGELKALPNDTEICHYLSPTSVKVPSDLGLMIEDGKFVRYDVGTDREPAPGGGRVGMSADEIRALYAGRIEEQAHKYVEGGRYLRIKDAAGGDGVLLFEADAAGTITAWRAGIAPQVDYVEGCS